MVGRSSGEPAAFLGYAHADDEHDGGLISEFRRRLGGELRAQTGREDLRIFQDRNDIAWGQAWRERIDSNLDAVTFFIPIVTPSFLASKECRRELTRFLDREREFRRNDLVLPVYWISVPKLDLPSRAAGDRLATALAARQYIDWRELRFRDPKDPEWARTMAALAVQIRDALDADPSVSKPRRARAAGARATSSTARSSMPGPPARRPVGRNRAISGADPGAALVEGPRVAQPAKPAPRVPSGPPGITPPAATMLLRTGHDGDGAGDGPKPDNQSTVDPHSEDTGRAPDGTRQVVTPAGAPEPGQRDTGVRDSSKSL